jgi:cytidylate kinase
VDTDYETVLSDIITRDNNDSSREIAPLKAADDAVIVDTTGLTLDESFEAIKGVIEERTANG